MLKVRFLGRAIELTAVVAVTSLNFVKASLVLAISCFI